MATEETTNVNLDKPIFPSDNLASEFDTLVDQIDTEFGELGDNWTVSDSTTEIIQSPIDLNFQNDIEVIDDGDGTITINSTAVSPDEVGVSNGIAELDSDAEVPTSQLPSLVVTETDVVADQTERLALDAEKGDIAVQQDENQSYILKGTDPSVDSNWTILKSPTDSVDSVFGRTGSITAQSGDYDHSQIGNKASDDHHAKYTDTEARSAVEDSTLNSLTLSRTGLNASEDWLEINGGSSGILLGYDQNADDIRSYQDFNLHGNSDINTRSGNVNLGNGSVNTNNFEVVENSSTNSLDFNYTG